jgi:Flp pilus assembly protein TadB
MTSIPFVNSYSCFASLPLAEFNLPTNYIIPIAGMIFAAVYVLIKSLTKLQKEKLRHETIRLAIEKGQPLPPELLERSIPNQPTDDRKSGLITLAVGVGLFVFLSQYEIGKLGLAWVAMIPSLIGVALLLNWALERRAKAKQDRP